VLADLEFGRYERLVRTHPPGIGPDANGMIQVMASAGTPNPSALRSGVNVKSPSYGDRRMRRRRGSLEWIVLLVGILLLGLAVYVLVYWEGLGKIL
jgi:hypothetical protein